MLYKTRAIGVSQSEPHTVVTFSTMSDVRCLFSICRYTPRIIMLGCGHPGHTVLCYAMWYCMTGEEPAMEAMYYYKFEITDRPLHEQELNTVYIL